MSALCQVQPRQLELESNFSSTNSDQDLEDKTLLAQVEEVEKKLIIAIWEKDNDQHESLYKELTGLISDNRAKIQNSPKLNEKCREIESWLNRSFPISTFSIT